MDSLQAATLFSLPAAPIIMKEPVRRIFEGLEGEHADSRQKKKAVKGTLVTGCRCTDWKKYYTFPLQLSSRMCLLSQLDLTTDRRRHFPAHWFRSRFHKLLLLSWLWSRRVHRLWHLHSTTGQQVWLLVRGKRSSTDSTKQHIII